MKNKKQLFIGLGIGFVVAIIAIVIIAIVAENIEYSETQKICNFCSYVYKRTKKRGDKKHNDTKRDNKPH